MGDRVILKEFNDALLMLQHPTTWQNVSVYLFTHISYKQARTHKHASDIFLVENAIWN